MRPRRNLNRCLASNLVRTSTTCRATMMLGAFTESFRIMHAQHSPQFTSLGLTPGTSQMLRSHYTKSFGPLNQKFVIRNHTFIAVDSPGLVDEDYMRNGRRIPFEGWAPLPDGTVSFVKQVARGTTSFSYATSVFNHAKPYFFRST